MLRFISLLVFTCMLSAQISARAGIIMPSAEHAPNLTSLGIGYNIIHSDKTPVNLIAEYSFASDLTVVEAGANVLYGFNEHIFAVAAALYSRESSHGVSHSDIAIIVGLAYEFNHQFGVEALYGINGDIKGPRAGITYHF